MAFRSKKTNGFSLIELIVVVAIFTIMTMILLANIPQFRDQTNLDLLAHQVAINIRQAQVFGVSSKSSLQTSGATNVFPWYLVRFQATDTFRLLTHPKETCDRPLECYQTDGLGGQVDQLQATYSLKGGYIFEKFLGCRSDQVMPNCDPISDLRIVFARPNPEAVFYIEGEGISSILSPQPYESVHIILKSLQSEKKKDIRVFANGQISVTNTQ